MASLQLGGIDKFILAGLSGKGSPLNSCGRYTTFIIFEGHVEHFFIAGRQSEECIHSKRETRASLQEKYCTILSRPAIFPEHADTLGSSKLLSLEGRI